MADGNLNIPALKPVIQYICQPYFIFYDQNFYHCLLISPNLSKSNLPLFIPAYIRTFKHPI